MPAKSIKNRDSSLDMIRIFAFLCVISVHFFYHNGFYEEIVSGKRMYLMVLMRQFFMICVPLFMTLSGYLMNRKNISKKYYLGVIKTLTLYVLCCICCLALKAHENPDATSPWIFEILNFTAAPYSWYIEMYIGLFLLIPFLNVVYHNLQEKKQKLLLVGTMMLLTALPLIVNLNHDILPAWWIDLYPITYYYIGAYLSEYCPKIKTRNLVLLLMAQVVLFGSFNFYMSYGSTFVRGGWEDFGSIGNLITTVLVFIIIKNINTQNWNVHLKNSIKYVASLCLGGYLVSWIFDHLFYPILVQKVPVMVYRLEYFIPMFLAVAGCSLLLSAALNLINHWITKFIDKILGKVHCNSCA